MVRGARLLLATALAAPTALPAATAVVEPFVVVVNTENPVTHLGRAAVSRLFLKRTTTWPDGTPVVPFDLSATDPLRNAFTLAVHRKPPEVVRAFWDQEIYSGRSLPPKVHASEQSLLNAVRAERGGIAYVSSKTELGSGVRVLSVDP
jgi:ABC-type phosphate transport system substrate-binding protein